MPEEKMSPSSPQLAIVEHQGVAVALSAKEVASIYKKSRQSGIPFDTLEEVYRRGYSSWTPDMNETPTQTAFNRINSFIAEGAAAAMDSDLINEKRGLWDNIHAKRERIKRGSGEHMRKPGSKGAPTDAAIKASQTDEEVIPFMSDDKTNSYVTSRSDGKFVSTVVSKDNKQPVDRQAHKSEKDAKQYLVSMSKRKNVAQQGPARLPTPSPQPNTTNSAARTEETDPCWSGYKQIGMKNKKGKKVPNCVPEERYMGAEKRSNDPNDPASRFDGDARVYIASTPGQEVNLKHVEGGSKLKTIKRVVKEKQCSCQESVELEEKWSDAKHKSPSGGLTRAGVMAYRRENPGSKLQTAVTTKPSKLKKGSKAANRRKSFCARMGGMKKRLTSAKTARDPDSRINKALRKWNC